MDRCWARCGKLYGLVSTTILIFILTNYLTSSGTSTPRALQVESGAAEPAYEPKPSVVVSASMARAMRHKNPGSFLGGGRLAISFFTMDTTDAQRQYHQQMVTEDLKCQSTKRFGHARDGGYDVCLDAPFAPVKGNCLVYSFGIRNDWSFDDEINQHLGCEVHSFDPSIKKKDHLHKRNMYFHNLGIWGSTMVNDKGWKLAGLSEIIKRLKHQNRTIDYVKLDVEGAEFPALREMIDSGVIYQVKQLAIEVHTPRLRAANEVMSLLDYAEIYQTFAELERAGFRKFLHYANNGCCGRFSDLTPASIAGKTLCCYETFYVNSNAGSL